MQPSHEVHVAHVRTSTRHQGKLHHFYMQIHNVIDSGFNQRGVCMYVLCVYIRHDVWCVCVFIYIYMILYICEERDIYILYIYSTKVAS